MSLRPLNHSGDDDENGRGGCKLLLNIVKKVKMELEWKWNRGGLVFRDKTSKAKLIQEHGAGLFCEILKCPISSHRYDFNITLVAHPWSERYKFMYIFCYLLGCNYANNVE